MAEDDETTTLPVSPLRITVRPLRSRLEQELELADQQSSNSLPTYQPLALPVERPDYLMPQQAIPGQPTPFAQQSIRESWPVRMVGSGITLPADVVAGKVDPVSDEGITRSVDLAGLGSVGPMAMAKAGTGAIPAIPAFFKKGLPLEERMAEWVQMQKQNMQNSPTLLSDSGTPGSGIAAVANSQHAPAFYSAVEQTVKNAKMQKGTADQWIGYLRNQAGVKPEELQWTGLNELPKGQISKADLEKHIAENKVQIGEVTKYIKPDAEAAGRAMAEGQGHNWANLSQVDKERYIRTADGRKLTDYGGDPKYSKYQLPGATNYKETLLTLPEGPQPGAQARIQNQMRQLEKARRERTIEAGPFNEQMNKLDNQLEELMKKGEGAGQTEYKSSHWDEPNVLAHIRTNDRMIDGKKTLHIEEIQSDWHQAGRKQGYKEDKKFEELKKQYDDAEKNYKPITELPEGFELTKDRDQWGVIPPGQIHAKPFTKLYSSKEAAVAGALDKINSQELFKIKEPLIEQMNRHHDGVPDAPFKKTWDELALKNIIRKAAEGGYDAISWTPGEAQAARYDLSKQVKRIYLNNAVFDAEGKFLRGKVSAEGSGVNLDKDVTASTIGDVIGKEAAEKLIHKPTRYEGPKDRPQQHVLEGNDLKVGGEGMKAFYDKMLVDKANTIGKKFGSKVEERDIGVRTGNKKTDDALDAISDALNKPRDQPKKVATVHYLPITKELKEHALSKGFPLFSSGLPVITPVSHNPFRLTPVEGDPFNPLTNKNAT